MGSPENTDSRHGLSRTDVVISFFVLLVMAALIVPAILTARQAYRNSGCLGRMQRFGLAFEVYTSTHDGVFPALSDAKGSWVVPLLPYLDYDDAYEKWKPAVDTQPGGVGSVYLKGFVCPDDPDKAESPGRLSYVVNAGYGSFPIDTATGELTGAGSHNGLNIDWDGDGQTGTEVDLNIATSTGLFWRPNPQGVCMNVDRVRQGDGMGQTLMLSESLNAGAAGNWAAPDLFNHAFVVGAAISKNNRPRSFGTTAGRLAITEKARLENFAINSNKGTKRGHWPSPSSAHPGGVNVFFADGSGRALSEDVDPRVYVRLLSAEGRRHGQQSVADIDFRN